RQGVRIAPHVPAVTQRGTIRRRRDLGEKRLAALRARTNARATRLVVIAGRTAEDPGGHGRSGVEGLAGTSNGNADSDAEPLGVADDIARAASPESVGAEASGARAAGVGSIERPSARAARTSSRRCALAGEK